MHLKSLKITALPGIEPGFEFKPAAPGINIVTGPNASGKSSLVRAIAHLLQPQRPDPPALSLEADFHNEDARWQVRRNGSQVVWTRNGEAADRPTWPAAGQVGMYRLAMEHLLDKNEDDQSLAKELQLQLSGGVNLDELRPTLTTMFAAHEATALGQAQTERREADRHYNDLRQQEAGLPALEKEIAAAENAERRCERLKQAIDLHHAIRERKAVAEELNGFPPNMHRLAGNEVTLLAEFEGQWQNLQNQLQQHQRDLTTHQAELQRTGLAESRPKPEEIAANRSRLQRIRDKSVERENAERRLTEAETAVREAIAQFNDRQLAPSLNAGNIGRSTAIAYPLVEAQAQRLELEQRLALAGEAPDRLEIERCRQGMGALRKWLAAATDISGQSQKKSAWRTILPLWIVLGAAVLAGLAAYLQEAFAAVAGAAAAIFVALWALWDGRRAKGPSPSEEARRRFTETDLEPPSEWTPTTVRGRLREIEGCLNNLLLQQERSANAEDIRNQIADVEANLAELNEQKAAFAQEAGFDPELPATALPQFVEKSVRWNNAREQCSRHKAGIDRLNQEITDAAKRVGEFIVHWNGGEMAEFLASDGSFDMDLLTCSFNALEERTAAAERTQVNIENALSAIKTIQGQIESTEGNIAGLFESTALAPEEEADLDQWQAAKRMLVHRIGRLKDWRLAQNRLLAARTTENDLRRSLRDHRELDRPAGAEATSRVRAERQYLAECLRWVHTGAIHQLEHERNEATAQANELENLRDQRTTVQTTLNNAGQDHKLENALAKEMQAQATLEDKRDQAFLSEATNVLLDDVKQAFQATHEPKVLQRARKLFAEVTSHAFDFKLDDDGQFTAQDLKQGAPRTLSELSSGTRMQLLLSLRLAWIQTQEQGTSPLPLFLDEALTTSDEDRFKVMAQSLERLSESEGRQIFYLSARRHEPALWRQATGNEPAVADLAVIRFNTAGAEPEDYEVEATPPVPAPDSHTPEAYAASLGVPQYDPRTSAGSIHLFHLLRDDLNLLHRLMDAWRINSLGQLEALLNSSAAQGAIADTNNHRQTLLNRCTAARHWAELWRQGQGKPVDRPALERSDAVTAVFIDRATDLAAELGGNGQALIEALRNGSLPFFQTNRISRLEQWLIDEGYIDSRTPLSADERRRLTLQRAMPQSDAQAHDLNQIIDQLEAALDEQPQ